MKQVLAKLALVATIILKVVPALLEALDAFEKAQPTPKPIRGAKGDS